MAMLWGREASSTRVTARSGTDSTSRTWQTSPWRWPERPGSQRRSRCPGCAAPWAGSGTRWRPRVHMEGQVLLDEQALIEGVGAGPHPHSNEGVADHVPQPPDLRRQLPVAHAAQQHLTEVPQPGLPKRLFRLVGRGHHRTVRPPLGQGLDGPGGVVLLVMRMVHRRGTSREKRRACPAAGDAGPPRWCRWRWVPGIQAAVPLDLLLSQAQLLVGRRHPAGTAAAPRASGRRPGGSGPKSLHPSSCSRLFMHRVILG